MSIEDLCKVLDKKPFFEKEIFSFSKEILCFMYNEERYEDKEIRGVLILEAVSDSRR
jgi:hypothetical protein